MMHILRGRHLVDELLSVSSGRHQSRVARPCRAGKSERCRGSPKSTPNQINTSCPAKAQHSYTASLHLPGKTTAQSTRHGLLPGSLPQSVRHRNESRPSCVERYVAGRWASVAAEGCYRRHCKGGLGRRDCD